MAEPKRWLQGNDAPAGALELLSSATPLSEMPEAAYERVFSRAVTLATSSGGAATGLGALVTTKGVALASFVVSGAAIAANFVGPPTVELPSERRERSASLVMPAEPANSVAKPAVSAAPSASPVEILGIQDLPLVKDETAIDVRPKRGQRLAEELALIERAKDLLEHDPGGALSIARRHHAAFPDGQMRAAADLIIVEALQRLGRGGEASQTAQAAKLRDPDGIYVPRLERATERHDP